MAINVIKLLCRVSVLEESWQTLQNFFSLTLGMIGKFALVLLCGVACVWASNVNYCDSSLCTNVGRGAKHVACSSNSVSVESDLRSKSELLSGFDWMACGRDVREIEMDDEMQEFILDLHNHGRARVARGELRKYGGCERMIQMSWDKELEHIAGFNSRKCKFEHDSCRNSHNFPYSGQNIAKLSASPRCSNVKAGIIEMFNRWYDEYQHCGSSTVKTFSTGHGPDIGHFTQIANNKASKVGCSVVEWMKHGTCHTYLVCNYALTNMKNQAVFPTGRACSKCETGCSTKYPGLCNVEESLVLKPLPYGVPGGLDNAYSSSVISSSSSSSVISSSSSSASTYSGYSAPVVASSTVTRNGVTTTTYTTTYDGDSSPASNGRFGRQDRTSNYNLFGRNSQINGFRF